MIRIRVEEITRMPRLARSFLPSTAVLEMTYRCTHECLFCSCPWEAGNGHFPRYEELTTGQWKALISRLCDMGIKNIAFTGGEALLREDIFEIIDHALLCRTEYVKPYRGGFRSYFASPKIFLLSNGDMVDESVLHYCRDRKIQLSMSLPGLETFEYHTGINKSEHILSQLRLARSLGVRTVAAVTVTGKNLYELEHTVTAALDAGAKQILLNRFLPGGRGLYFEGELTLGHDEISSMLYKVENILAEHRRYGSVGTEIPRCLIDISRFERLTVGTRCAAAKRFFVIGPSGFVRVCNHSQVRLNNVNEIEDLKHNEYWKAFASGKYLPDQCLSCPESFHCDGGCREAAHIAGGSISSPDVVFREGAFA
jgi:radical SAM protein with 4Fe4S-binding SPASM domain